MYDRFKKDSEINSTEEPHKPIMALQSIKWNINDNEKNNKTNWKLRLHLLHDPNFPIQKLCILTFWTIWFFFFYCIWTLFPKFKRLWKHIWFALNLTQTFHQTSSRQNFCPNHWLLLNSWMRIQENDKEGDKERRS